MNIPTDEELSKIAERFEILRVNVNEKTINKDLEEIIK